MDVILELAKKRAIADSVEIEAQFSLTEGCRPLLNVLHRARGEAAEALAALAVVEFDDQQAIKHLQNHIARFRDLVGWLSKIVTEGIESDTEISDAEREELIEALVGTPEGQQQAIDLGYLEGVPRHELEPA